MRSQAPAVFLARSMPFSKVFPLSQNQHFAGLRAAAWAPWACIVFIRVQNLQYLRVKTAPKGR